MNYRQRFKLLVGPDIGAIVEGAEILAWDTGPNYEILKRMIKVEKLAWDSPQVEAHWRIHCDPGAGDGVWIPSLNQRFKAKEVENQFVPFDRYDKEILVGDIVAYAMRDLTVAKMKITKFVVRNRECVMYGVDVDSNKATHNHSPEKCIKLTS
jgi:hypothetical protein